MAVVAICGLALVACTGPHPAGQRWAGPSGGLAAGRCWPRQAGWWTGPWHRAAAVAARSSVREQPLGWPSRFRPRARLARGRAATGCTSHGTTRPAVPRRWCSPFTVAAGPASAYSAPRACRRWPTGRGSWSPTRRAWPRITAGLRREARSPGRGCRALGAEALSGALSELALPSPGTNPDGIAAGPRQTIWVTETGSDAIARVTLLAARRASG